MLAHNTPSKSRPLPPAKARRARTPSLPVQPPPPYAPRMDMILDSPIAVTAQLVGSRSPTGMQGGQSLAPAVEEWMNEKSREELSNLLVAAGDIIKSRETELGLTSALVKNLYEENVNLKTKHDAFIARIPGRDGPSPLPSPTRSLSPLPPNSPHYYSASRPASPGPVTKAEPPQLSRPLHTRRISVTPGELSLLADQNAELLDKLEKLEEESASADLAGKKKLRKLEKEIAGLRSELDKTREKGEELEMNLKKRGIGLTPEEEEDVRRKREEREERLKALRDKAGPQASASESSLQEIRDFAPAPELPRLRTVSNPKAPALNLATKPQPIPAPIIEEGVYHAHSNSAPASAVDLTSYFPVSASASGSSIDTLQQSAPQLEYAIIAQLLSKIRELEETNVEIAHNQKTATAKLQAVQRDSESIRRAYDVLAEGGNELQVLIEDAECDAGPPSASASPVRNRIPTGSTIKFSSLRRSIEGDVGMLALTEDPREEFASGITKQSTTRSTHVFGSPVQQKGKFVGQKSRQTVVGLFDVNPRSDPISPSYPATLSVSPDFRTLSPIPFPSAVGDTSVWSNAATDGFAEPSSPTPSRSTSPSPSIYSSPLLNLNANTLELVTNTSTVGSTSGPQPLLHSLGSELGSEFGDDWGERAGNHHLRATSLADISALWQRESSPAVGPEIILPSPSTSPQSESCWEDVDESPPPPPKSATSGTGTEVGTPTKSRGTNGLQLQLVIEPPTPSPNKYLRTSPNTSVRGSSPLAMSASTSALSLRESRSSRNLRLSQTVKARTSRWVERVERRYAEPHSSMEDVPAQPVMKRRRSVTSLAKRQRRTSTALDETFDLAARQVSRSFSSSSIDFRNFAEEDELESADLGSGLKRQVVLANSQDFIGYEVSKKRDGFVGFILEVWLWLQFAIVVGVFLWAMARRGPKSVLEDAEKRRMEAQRISRR